ncbi:MAG: 4-(cytidine 5'-diphospho)-2-C-methyl-D-erythritol kinase [Candidatus Bipolaricaulia bacterium]
MERFGVRTPAKINLFLDVLDKRPDGYHEIRTVFHKIALYDTVTVEPIGSGIEIVCDHPLVPRDERNLCWKAAQVLIDRCDLRAGARIQIEKHIPVSSGLGGGSSDTAAVLRAMDALFGLDLSELTLQTVGAQLGADVPAFLAEEDCLYAEGIGDRLRPISGGLDHDLVLIHPSIELPKGVEKTGWAYARLNRHPWTHPNPDPLIAGIEAGEIGQVTENLFNAFEPVWFEAFPVVEWLRAELDRRKIPSLLCGAGPAVFAVTADLDDRFDRYGQIIRTQLGWKR